MHQKHTKLTRPQLGNFGRNEWAIIGTPCGVIKKIAFELIESLSPKWKVAYVDADHKNVDGEIKEDSCAMTYGAALEYTDKITFHRFDLKAKLDVFQYRQHFNEMDTVLVNGNHFKAQSQIVVIDPRKEDSLRRKLDRLTDVQLILLQENVTEIPVFLKTYLTNIEDIPVLKITEKKALTKLCSQKMEIAVPPLSGLVLAGGKSTRMGKNKGRIDYHGKPQQAHLFELMSQICTETYLSCRPEQAVDFEQNFPILSDSFIGLGPFGAIASAFLRQPNHAWLIIACDLPLLDKSTLQFLVEQRNPSSIATAFNSPVNQFPEPLIAIWEPKSYPILLQFLAQGYSCPRKVLINSDVHLLDAFNPLALKNVNTPEEYEEAMLLLQSFEG